MATVRVAKIVCFTLLAMTFVIGFFVVTHKWVQSKECHCGIHDSIRHSALMAHPPSVKNLDNNRIEESIKDQQPIESSPEVANQEQEEIDANQAIESLDDVLRLEGDVDVQEGNIQDINKSVKLPIDLLLNNPALVGKNVNCKVQRKQQKIAEGIMSQAIIVTCDDENSAENDDVIMDTPIMPHGMRRLKPPMSLLGSIMKILADRPRSRELGQPKITRIDARPMPFPIKPSDGPFPMPGPIIRPIRGPFPGPFGPGVVHLIPIKKIDGPRMHREGRFLPEPIVFPSRGPIPSIRPIARINDIQGHPMPHPMGPPLPPGMLMRDEFEGHPRPLPFPLPSLNGQLPIKVIRIPPGGNMIREDDFEEPRIAEEEVNDGPFPLPPFHPIMKMFPARRTRIIRLRPKMREDEEGPQMLPFPPSPFISREPKHIELPPIHLPPQMHLEASGRALPAPVALPNVVMRQPFKPQPPPLPEARLVTHMEVREPPKEIFDQLIQDINKEEEKQHINIFPLNIEPKQPEDIQPRLPVSEPENETFPEENDEFGPPKTHTVIESVPEPIQKSPKEDQGFQPMFNEHDFQPFVSLPGPPPPPPKFAAQGRTSLTAELNPDAEVINQDDKTSEPKIHRIIVN